jgi:hypothetical protein
MYVLVFGHIYGFFILFYLFAGYFYFLVFIRFSRVGDRGRSRGRGRSPANR